MHSDRSDLGFVGEGGDLVFVNEAIQAESALDFGKKLHSLLNTFRASGRAQGLSRKRLEGARNRAERRLAMAHTVGYLPRGNPAKASRRAGVRQAKRRAFLKAARDAHLKAAREAHLKALEEKTRA